MTDAFDLQFETVPCPLCGSQTFRHLITGRDRLYHVSGEYQVVRCCSCRHVFVNPRPVLEQISRCYPDDYGPYLVDESTVSDEAPSGNPPPASRPPWYLNKWVRSVPGLRRLYYWITDDHSTVIPPDEGIGKTALDVGCSTGAFLEKLRQQGWDATGVEIAERPAHIARNRGFRVHLGTLESADLDDASFGAVFAWMVLEHLHDPRSTLLRINSLLDDGGWFVGSVPNFACWERLLFRGYWRGLELPRHLQHFTPGVLKKVLRESGFGHVHVIHQSNLNNVVASIGMLLRDHCPTRSWGQQLIDLTDRPSLRGILLLAPFARVLAWLHQGGRLTVVARKTSDPHRRES